MLVGVSDGMAGQGNAEMRDHLNESVFVLMTGVEERAPKELETIKLVGFRQVYKPTFSWSRLSNIGGQFNRIRAYAPTRPLNRC